MRRTIHQAVQRATLLLLALGLLLCAVPTAQAMRFSTSDTRSGSPSSTPSQPGACYGVETPYGDVRIGLFVGNNPINYTDPFGLTTYYSPWPYQWNDPHDIGPYVAYRDDGRDVVEFGPPAIFDTQGITDLSVSYTMMAVPASESKTFLNTALNLLGLSKKPCPGAAERPLLPESYWKSEKAPTQVDPGTRRITDLKPSSRKAGEVYERTTHYDEFGRSTGQTHMTDHGEPSVHPNPHYHTRNPITGQESGAQPGVHPDY